MPDRRSPEFPLLFLHAAARYLAVRRVTQLADSPPAPRYCVVAQPTATAPVHDFLSALLPAAGLWDLEADTATLTPRAHTWLAQPLPLQLDALRQAWWHTLAWEPRAWPALDFPAWLVGRWATVVTTVCRWLVQCPTDQWSAWADLERILTEQRLYAPSGVQGNLPRLRRATRACVNTLARGLLLLALPALGLSEARRQAASWHARPTSEGKRWLTVALERRQAHAAVAQELRVPVLDFRAPAAWVTLSAAAGAVQVYVPPGAPLAATFTLMHVAQLQTLGPPAVYRLTADSLAQGAAWGLRPDYLRFWLTRWSAGEVPRAALRLLHTWQETQQQLTATPGYRLHGPAALLAGLRKRRTVRRRTTALTTGDLWVAAEQAPAFFRYLRQRDYVVHETSQTLPVGSYALRALPLPALLALCRTYILLREQVPGLAALQVETLSRDLEAALSPAERQAADRLSAAQWRSLAAALPGSAERPAPDYVRAAETTAALRERLATAVANQTPLTLTYIDAQARVTERQVHPLRLEERWGHTYLVARCALRAAERRFRLDRIVGVAS